MIHLPYPGRGQATTDDGTEWAGGCMDHVPQPAAWWASPLAGALWSCTARSAQVSPSAATAGLALQAAGGGRGAGGEVEEACNPAHQTSVWPPSHSSVIREDIT